MSLKDWFEQKKEAWARWRAIQDAADAEGRQPTAEEKEEMDRCNEVIEEVQLKINEYQQEQARRVRLLEIGQQMQEMPPVQLQARGDDGAAAAPDKRSMAEKMRDYSAEGMSRKQALDRIAGERTDLSKSRDQALRQYLTRGYIDPGLRERAALQMDSDADGGFLVVPEQFVARLIQDLDRMVFIRQFATIIPVANAESLGVPSLDTDIADTNWTTELAVGTADSSMVFGKRRLTPHPLAKYILVSKDLLRSAALSVEAIVRERMGYKFGTVQEAGFMTGTGANQPLGLFTASGSGISTSQDVSTDNTSSAVTADGLINAKYALESQWLASANLRWVFHRDIVKMIRKLKDGDGQYLLSPGLRADSTDTLLGVPVVMSEYAPNTVTSGAYVGLIGDLSYYWIADNMSMDIQRLVELGALTNQDYFVGRMKLDGMPVLEKAFVRVTLG